MKLNIIGAGRFGKNLALALEHAKITTLQAICNTHYASAQLSCQSLGFGFAVEHLASLPTADITWLACNDDAIIPVVATLAQQQLLQAGSFVFHSSGALSSAVLKPLKEQGCHIGSLHPLKAFPTNYLDAQAFNQVFCVTEGDDSACAWLHQAFTLLEARLISIDPAAKAAYHAGACMASNYLITLAACSERVFLNAGIKPEDARQITCALMQSNLNNMRSVATIAEALTGPIMRGDAATLDLHLQAITNPKLQTLYKAIGNATLALTTLPEASKSRIQALLV